MLQQSVGRAIPTQAEAIAGKLITERGEAISQGKAKAKKEKEDLLRPRRWVPPEKRDKN
jgi:hypothetical protein